MKRKEFKKRKTQVGFVPQPNPSSLFVDDRRWDNHGIHITPFDVMILGIADIGSIHVRTTTPLPITIAQGDDQQK
jgi:hypothetical protein